MAGDRTWSADVIYRVVVTLTGLLMAGAAVLLPVETIRATPTTTEIPISGYVLAPDGEPLSKADVVLEPIPSTYERARLRLAGLVGPEPVALTQTDADGAFQLGAPSAGMWKVVVSSPTLLTMERRLLPLVAEMVLPPVEMMPKSELEVRVVDRQGKPRPGRVGAYAFSVRYERVRNEGWRPRIRLATAGDDGLARLPLGRDEEIQLEVLAEGYPLVVTEVSKAKPVIVELPIGAAGTVRAIGRKNRPLRAAIVLQGSFVLPLGLTNDEGRLDLVVQADEPDPIQVFTADRWSGSLVPDLDAVEIQDLRLDPPKTVFGRILDLTTREPIAGALVWAVQGQVAVTDKQGSYELAVDLVKPHRMGAAAAGYLRDYAQMSHSAEPESLAIGLAPAAAVLSGKVRDATGAVLGGVMITVRPKPRSGQQALAVQYAIARGWQTRTSDRGTFRVPGLPAHMAFGMTLQAAGFAAHSFTIEPLEPFERRADLEVVMSPARHAVGWVVDEDEVPIAGAAVSLVAPPLTNDLQARNWISRRQDDGQLPTVLTDQDGQFEMSDLAAGYYDLEVAASGYAPSRIPGVQVLEMTGDDATKSVDLGVVVMVPGVSVEGRVVDLDGAALHDAKIQIKRPGSSNYGAPRSAREPLATGPEGRFVAPDLNPGRLISILISKSGFVSKTVEEVQPPTIEPLTIILQPAGRLRGRVVDQQGDPQPNSDIYMRLDSRSNVLFGGSQRWSQLRHTSTDADGRFLIEEVEPATWWVAARSKGYQLLVEEGVEVQAGATTDLELVLEVGAVVEGTILTADGEPLTQASISIAEAENLSSRQSGTVSSLADAEGHYRAVGVPVGLATVTVFQNSTRRLGKSIEVRPGTNVVDLLLESGFEIGGQVVAPDGTPIGDAAVTLDVDPERRTSRSPFNSSRDQTAADGSFVFADVVAGAYRLTASRDDFAPASTESFEVASDVAGLVLQLGLGATLKGRIVGLEIDELGVLELTAYSRQSGRAARVLAPGDYQFDQLAAGVWHLRAEVKGSSRSLALTVDIPEGVTEVVRDIEFGPTLTLRGIVLDNDRPAAGVGVSVSGADSSSGYDQTDSDGRFRIGNLPANHYTVMVSAGMGARKAEELELTGDHELRIDIATGALNGVVRSAIDGEPVSGVGIAFALLDRSDPAEARRNSLSERMTTDARGGFGVARIRPGRWRLVASKSGYAPSEVVVAIAAEGVSDAEIQLTPTEGVSFEVSLASGAEATWARVSILDASGRHFSGGSYPIVEGRVHVPTVPSGRWELVVQVGDSAATRVVVDSPGDQGRIFLPTSGRLSLSVPELAAEPWALVFLTGPDGKPLVHVGGSAFDPGAWPLISGQASVPSLAPGVWTLIVEHDGRTWNGSATVVAGRTSEAAVVSR